MRKSRVTLGRICGVFGVQGWVKVYSYTEPRENIVSYHDWLLCKEGQEKPVRVLGGRLQGRAVVAQLSGINDRDAAQALLDWEIQVPRSVLPPTAPGQYYWADLEGLDVRTREGRLLGTVAHMLETPVHDVMVIQHEDRQRLVPFVQGEYVLEVNLDDGVIVVDWDPEF